MKLCNRNGSPDFAGSIFRLGFVLLLSGALLATPGCGGGAERDGRICASCKGPDDAPCQNPFVTTPKGGPVLDFILASEGCSEGPLTPGCSVCDRNSEGVLNCTIPLGCIRAKSPSKANRCYPIDADTGKAIPTISCEDQLPDPNQVAETDSDSES